MEKRKMLLIALCMCTVMAGCANSKSNTSEKSVTEENQSSVTKASEDDELNVGTGDAYDNNESNVHAVSVNNEEVSYDNIAVTKSGDSDGDESDFYGTNAAVFAENGAKLTITNSKITTDGSHANAVFSYGEGTVINISDSIIETSKNNSGGIMVTGGGELNASQLIVTTQGGSSAAIRSDRGGGVMNVDGGTYKSYGAGSPAIYSTAEVNVSNATLYSDISQAVVVEGKNSVTLNNVDATGKNTNKNSDKSDRYQAVMIYQSMSGDATQGKGQFTMRDGSLTSLNGGMFFVTNTVADITLEGVTLNYATDDLLRIEKAGWGNEGNNGGQVNFNASNQELKGEICVDEISKLNLYLKDGSAFEGTITGDGEVYVELDEGSVWKLTGDSNIKALSCDENAIDLNGYTLTVDGTNYSERSKNTGEAIEFVYSSAGKTGDPPPDGMTPPPDGNGSGGSNGDSSEGMISPPKKPE